MLQPAFLAWLDVFMAQGTAIGSDWGFGGQAFLQFRMGGVLSTGDRFLAFGAAFVELVLFTFSEEVVVEVGYFHGLLALLAERYHRTGRVKMLVPVVVILEALVEGFAVVAVVLRILGLLL